MTPRVLVTGASRGIGRAIAEGLAAAGADVAVTSRSLDHLADVEAAIVKSGRRAVPVAMDVTQVTSCRDGVARAAKALGGLDILINNAGVEQVSPSLDIEEELWDRILDTNLKGAFFAAQAAARLMKAIEAVTAKKVFTPDLGGTARTKDVTQAVIAAL